MLGENELLKQKIKEFIHGVSPIWADEPLDGDETEEISRKILLELDSENGNITDEEYSIGMSIYEQVEKC